jgi:hypothetical protein
MRKEPHKKPLPVTRAAMRPASKREECFYCHQPIGADHKPECVLILKMVKVRMIVEYELDTPSSWDKEMIESYYNGEDDDKGNLPLAEFEWKALAESRRRIFGIRFKYLRDRGGEFLEES